MGIVLTSFTFKDKNDNISRTGLFLQKVCKNFCQIFEKRLIHVDIKVYVLICKYMKHIRVEHILIYRMFTVRVYLINPKENSIN